MLTGKGLSVRRWCHLVHEPISAVRRTPAGPGEQELHSQRAIQLHVAGSLPTLIPAQRTTH